MSGDGLGLQLTLRIKRLMRKHGIEQTVWDLCLVPTVEPTDGPMLLQGRASTSDVDRHHTKIRGWCFGFPLPRYCKSVPLLHKHDPKQIAGRIEQLEYDASGGLLVRARVDHAQARRCNAFSVAVSVLDYEIRNAERSDFFAVINSARLDEISLTDVPANPHALVTGRYPVSPQVQFYEHALSAMQLLQQSLAILQQMQKGVRA